MNKRERNEIIISWLTISIAFSVYLSDGFLNIVPLASSLPISLIATATGFILHELAHKYTALRFGVHAEYRMWKYGLIATLALPIITGVLFSSPILFAAPGAVYIFGENISRKHNGIISAVGPLTNIVVGGFFLAIAMLFSLDGFIRTIIVYTAQINLWLAFFNLLPIPPLDGSKVMSWNVGAWALMIVPLAAFFFLPF